MSSNPEETAPDPGSACRLFVYLARTEPLAIVLRRGPSDWARLSLWRTADDTFTHGQWIHARVYERRCDCSDDGSLFIAFVRDSARPGPSSTDTWIAVSRPPWFSALALWFVGGTYHTGGMFPDGRTLWIGSDPAPPDQGTLPAWLATTVASPPYSDHTANWTNRTVWLNRLHRLGWRADDTGTGETWSRPNPRGSQILIMTIGQSPTGGLKTDFTMRNTEDREDAVIGPADWADWDQRGRLVLARGGQLRHWREPGLVDTIADLNDQRPDPRPAPSAATIWPLR